MFRIFTLALSVVCVLSYCYYYCYYYYHLNNNYHHHHQCRVKGRQDLKLYLISIKFSIGLHVIRNLAYDYGPIQFQSLDYQTV